MISGLSVTSAGVATWTNTRPYGIEVVVLWNGPDGLGWKGIDRTATSFTIPTKTSGRVSVRVLQDSSDANTTFTVPVKPPPPPPPPPPPKVQGGIAAGGNLQNEDPVTLGKDLDVIKALGATILRVDINWAQVQDGGPSSYNWTADAVVKGAIDRGINVHGGIVYAPSWAAATAQTPASPTAYATFVTAAVKHYAAMGVHSYEMGNEPNLGQNWGGRSNATTYTTMLKAAYVAAKQADPSCTVVSAGLSPAPSDGTNLAPTDFLTGIYVAGGQGFFDAVGHHPYCSPAMPGDAQGWSAWYQMYGAAVSLRTIMGLAGDGAKKIWATEYGAPTDGPSGDAGVMTEAQQAAMITTAFRVWGSYSWAGPLFVYQHRDNGSDPSTNQDWYGLTRFDGSLKPAYTAYQAAVR